MILILVIVDNGLVRACFRSNNVLLCLVLILVVVDNGLVLVVDNGLVPTL